MNKIEWQKRDQVIVDAAMKASNHFTSHDVPHCLVGRLGLLSQGYNSVGPNNDIFFLIDAKVAFMDGGDGVVATKASLPLSVGDVRVKWCSFEKTWESDVWNQELVIPRDGEVPVGLISMLLCLMMLEGDESSVYMAIADGAPYSEAMEILQKHEISLGAKFKLIVEDALR